MRPIPTKSTWIFQACKICAEFHQKKLPRQEFDIQYRSEDPGIDPSWLCGANLPSPLHTLNKNRGRIFKVVGGCSTTLSILTHQKPGYFEDPTLAMQVQTLPLEGQMTLSAKKNERERTKSDSPFLYF